MITSKSMLRVMTRCTRPDGTEASGWSMSRYCTRIVICELKTIIRRYVGTGALNGRLENMDSILHVAYVLSTKMFVTCGCSSHFRPGFESCSHWAVSISNKHWSMGDIAAAISWSSEQRRDRMSRALAIVLIQTCEC